MHGEGFSAAVEAQHHRLDRSQYGNVYVVGDVHGCRETVGKLLDALELAGDDLVVFVGDLVRRGPDSRGVIDLVRSSPNLLSVRGNNEEKLVRGRRRLPELTAADVRWLRSLPLVVSWTGHVVVHGGIDPRKPRERLTVPELQNTSSISADASSRPYWWERYDGPDRVFFGHTVLERPYVGDAVVGLDTGCVYGGRLTAYDCGNDRLVAVEPPRTYHDRPPEKFVSPSPEASVT